MHAYNNNYSPKNVDKYLPANSRHPIYKTGLWQPAAAFGRVRVGYKGLEDLMA